MSPKKGKSKKLSSDISSNTEHDIRQLPVSKELVAHYRAKLSALNNEYEDLSARVDECRALFDADCHLQQELVQRNAEVSRLRQAVSDLQVYVFEEREQALQLYAENDRLKVRQLEDRKKIDLLLSLSGTTEEEVSFFLKDSSRKAGIIPQFKCNNNTKQTVKNKSFGIPPKVHLSEKTESGEPTELEMLQLQIQSLNAQLSEQTKLYRDKTSALLQDRELSRAERAADQARYDQLLEALTARLQKSEGRVCDLTSALLQSRRDYRGHEEGWVSERDRLLKSLDLCKEQLGEVFPSGGAVLPGSGLRSARSCGELSILKDQLAERDRLLAMYQEQCAAMEQEVSRLRDQAESSKNQFKNRVQKMAAQVTYLRSKYNELDRRRVLEAEGFRSDIRLMRSRLRDLERGFNKISARPSAVSTTSQGMVPNSANSNSALISTARDTVERARQLELELKHIHGRVVSLESELKLTTDDV